MGTWLTIGKELAGVLASLTGVAGFLLAWHQHRLNQKQVSRQSTTSPAEPAASELPTSEPPASEPPGSEARHSRPAPPLPPVSPPASTDSPGSPEPVAATGGGSVLGDGLKLLWQASPWAADLAWRKGLVGTAAAAAWTLILIVVNLQEGGDLRWSIPQLLYSYLILVTLVSVGTTAILRQLAVHAVVTWQASPPAVRSMALKLLTYVLPVVSGLLVMAAAAVNSQDFRPNDEDQPLWETMLSAFENGLFLSGLIVGLGVLVIRLRATR